MKERYVILRTKDVDLSDPFSGALTASTARHRSSEFTVESRDLDRASVSMVEQDRHVVGAPSMDLRLIEPTASEVTAASNNVTWGVDAVGATDTPFTGSGVIVAILDTGIDADHPAFQGVDLVQKDFTGEGNGDQNGHGTHVAGTVFGRDVNGTRIGVARGVERALIGKVLGKEGGGSTEMIVEAINWALTEGANVISMSLSIDFPGFVKRLTESFGFPVELATSKALEGYRANTRLLDRLAGLVDARFAKRGTLLVAASGNESRRDVNPDFEITAGPPAAADTIVAVGAVGEDDSQAERFEVAPFSNVGVQVCAPGVGILSAQTGGGLVAFNGTSMATPHVAGVAALWAEKLLLETDAIDPKVLSNRLIGQATKLVISGDRDPLDIGTGMVQVPRS